MVVDWSRHCYQSQWRLFSDSTVATPGFYYFAKEGTPHFPTPHNFWSRCWLDRNHPQVQGLGEVLTAKQTFRTGEFAFQRPEPRVVGEARCFADGEPIAEAAPPQDLEHGYPTACFVPLPVPDDFPALSSFDTCEVAKLWARIIDKLYVGDATGMQAIIDAVAQGPRSYFTLASRNNYPALFIVKGSDYACVAIDGTRNFEQFALQTLDVFGGPTDFGLFATLPLWYNASTDILTRLQASGINDQRRIFLVGHSYGGVAGMVLAARFRANAPGREIKYLTFGAPKIGDERLQVLVAACNGIALRNDDDLVTMLPPDKASLDAIMAAFDIPGLALWGTWQRPPRNLTQDEDGVIVPGGNYQIDFDTLAGIVAKVVADETFARIAGHGISEYIRRITLRCPDPAWPVSAEIEEMDSEPIWTAGMIGLGWTTSSGGVLAGGHEYAIRQDGGAAVSGHEFP